MQFSRSSGHLGGTPPLLDIPSVRVMLPHFLAELSRARRYEHALAVVAVRVSELPPGWHNGAGSAGHGLQPREAASALYLLLGSILRNTFRENDLLGAAPESLAYLAVLPETDGAGAAGALKRVGDAVRSVLGVDLRSGIALFPGDGFTLEDLLEQARAGLERAPTIAVEAETEATHG